MPDVTSSDTGTTDSLGLPSHSAGLVPLPVRPPQPRQKIADLIDEWLADESGYDERVWPQVKKALEVNRAGSRRLFDG